jgi:hypothetical protein
MAEIAVTHLAFFAASRENLLAGSGNDAHADSGSRTGAMTARPSWSEPRDRHFR